MVPLRGCGTSFEPSVIEPGEVDRSLADAVMVDARASSTVSIVDRTDSCLGGKAGG